MDLSSDPLLQKYRRGLRSILLHTDPASDPCDHFPDFRFLPFFFIFFAPSFFCSLSSKWSLLFLYLDQMKITGYQDRAIVPVPKADGTDYREVKQKQPVSSPIKPITMLQPHGPSFTIDGHIVRYGSIPWKSILDLCSFYILRIQFTKTKIF